MAVRPHPQGGYTIAIETPGSTAANYSGSYASESLANQALAMERNLTIRRAMQSKHHPGVVVVEDTQLDFLTSIVAPTTPERLTSKFTPAQQWSLDELISRSDSFKPWLADLYVDADEAKEALKNPETSRELFADYLDDEHSISVDKFGIVSFETLSPGREHMIGDLPVKLFHHTASGVEANIKQEGLRPRMDVDTNCYGTGSGENFVFLTSEAGGVTPDLYCRSAQAKHGGDQLSLEVVMRLSELQPDPDDSDIGVGKRQFVAAAIPPARLLEYGSPSEALHSVGAPAELAFAVDFGRRPGPARVFTLGYFGTPVSASLQRASVLAPAMD